MINKLTNGGKPVIIAVIRGVYGDKCLKLVNALKDGGISVMEITFGISDDQKTLDTLELVADRNKDLIIGAGTVMDKRLVKKAKEVGARFIVSPSVDKKIIKATVKAGLISIAGALSPTEMVTAREYGADYIKLFPAGTVGAKYIKAVKYPLEDLRILAFAGIDKTNIKEFIDAGVDGFGIGDALFDKKLVDDEKYGEITENAKSLLSIVNK